MSLPDDANSGVVSVTRHLDWPQRSPSNAACPSVLKEVFEHGLVLCFSSWYRPFFLFFPLKLP